MTIPKILYAIHGLDIGGREGGAEKAALDVAMGISKTGLMEISVFSLWDVKTETATVWATKLTNAGIALEFGSPLTVDEKYTPKTWLFAATRMVSTIWRTSPAIVHSHASMTTLPLLLSRRAINGRHLVRTAQSTEEWGRGTINAILDLLHTQLLAPAFGCAEIAVSDAIRKLLDSRRLARLLKRKAHLIHNSISPFDQHSQNGPIRLINIGRLTEQKGQDVLLKAFAKVVPFHDVELHLYGDGEWHGKLVDLKDTLGLASKVKFHGTRSDVRSELGSNCIFVLPSRWEGLPLTLLEAMHAGCCIIASDIPAMHEAAGDAALFIGPGDVDALANAISMALSSPDLRLTLGRKAMNRSQQFNLDATINAHIALYNRIFSS